MAITCLSREGSTASFIGGPVNPILALSSIRPFLWQEWDPFFSIIKGASRAASYRIRVVRCFTDDIYHFWTGPGSLPVWAISDSDSRLPVTEETTSVCRWTSVLLQITMLSLQSISACPFSGFLTYLLHNFRTCLHMNASGLQTFSVN